MAHFADYTARMRRILCAEAGKQGGSVKIFSKKARQNRYSKERSPMPFSLSDSSRSGQIGLNQSVLDWFITDSVLSFATEWRQRCPL
jgi:hypothetical protein